MTRRSLFLTALSASRILGANDRIRLGLIGCGGRGRYVAKFMADNPGVEFSSVCDVHQPTAAAARQWAGEAAKQPDVKEYGDLRKLLDNKDVDAVLIATPDHWHGLAAVMACQAGKDAYVEKPIAHNIVEGQAIVKAAKRHNRLVMAGTQQRSAPHFAEVAKIISGGQLGTVHYVRVWNFTNMLPDGIGKVADSAPPEGLDWDMYLGPAPKVPYNRKRFQSTFRWFWDYAGGTITDYGTHRFDTVLQIMGDAAPKTIAASGGRFALKDAGEMPDVLHVTYEFPGWVMSYEMSNISAHGLGGRTEGMKYYNAKGSEDRPHGMAFYGTNGALFADRIGFEIYPDNDKTSRRSMNTKDATPLHAKNFVQALRSRNPGNASIEVGHRATTIAHLGNIAFKTGKKLHWDGASERFDDSEANRLLRRAPRKQWDLFSS